MAQTPVAWIPYTVGIKDALADLTWDEAAPISSLECLTADFLLMPTIDRATFRFRAGRRVSPGATDWAYVEPADWIGKYIRVRIGAGGAVGNWYGYMVNEQTAREAAIDAPAGGGVKELQGYTPDYWAVGLEWFLGRNQIDKAVFYDTGVSVDTIYRPPGFNTGTGNGRALDFARRGNRAVADVGGFPVFAKSYSTQQLWSATAIVKYILKWDAPTDSVGVVFPAPFALHASAEPFLDDIFPTIQTEGRTPLDILNAAIDRRRGLTWWFEYDDAATTIYLKVSSLTTVPIALPDGGSLPAALNVIDYDFDEDINVKGSQVGNRRDRKYDLVKVRGARRTSTFTASFLDANLESNWTSALESDYLEGAGGDDAELNDKARKAPKFDAVFTEFRIPESWTGQAGDGSGAGPYEYVSPDMAQGSTSILGGEPVSITGLRTLRTTPLLATWDYTDATNPVSKTPPESAPEHLKPFAVVSTGNNKFVPLDKAAGAFDSESTSYQPPEPLKHSFGLLPLQGAPGVEVRPSTGLPHALALANWAGAKPSAVEPEIDFNDIRFTICVEWDSYAEGYEPNVAPAAKPIQTLVIDVGERYRLDYLAVETVLDVDATGALVKCTTGGPIRDDRQKLRDLAVIAFAWYATPRATLDLMYHTLTADVALGDLIRNIGTAGQTYEQTVNSAVSKISHRPEEGASMMGAGFVELDFRKFL